ncbi:MAG: DUF1800 domain-containing protein [Rhodobacteraceae bacterium]|nr:DUF1800 domain-containing protein [Paracoccaceae bacterium]
MVSEATYSAIRFGFGLGPAGLPKDLEAALAGLSGPDAMAERYPMLKMREALPIFDAYERALKNRKAPGAQKKADSVKGKINYLFESGMSLSIARIAESKTPLRERLMAFWVDHFTAAPKHFISRLALQPYLDQGLRPHITGTFGDLLVSAVTHPFMLNYLDQVSSVGPNSAAGKNRGRGLNENLAREVLELHTLGVGASYTQTDVRQLAELFTGLNFSADDGFVFDPRRAEPGPEVVLGKKYGIWQGRLEDVHAVLQDLAVHPDTAAHVSRKLAVHFVSDAPDEAMVQHMTAAWTASRGDIKAVMGAMLEHPAARRDFGAKAKRPFDFIASIYLALGTPGDTIAAYEVKELRRRMIVPSKTLNQPWMKAGAPDGWPEDLEHWINAQALATRIKMASQVGRMVGPHVRQPSRFVDRVLGDAASERLRWAVGAAETREDAIALVIASPEFNRR